MNCPTCQTPNRDLARFCRACGLWLVPHCPFCNAEIPVASAFCDQCGRRISESASQRVGESAIQRGDEATSQRVSDSGIRREGEGQGGGSPIANLQSHISPELAAKLTAARETRAMEGQRRVVTMLFCDVQGSTEAASRLDPEEWAGIINAAFECMITPVVHYEGTVARLMGDGLLAFFGAPIAHEDDPVRAVLAGLDILEAFKSYQEHILLDWGIPVNVRVGINTGLVVVGAVGSDLQVEYSALGDAINVAARMEQTAKPGTVQISEETYKLVAPLFEVEDLGLVRVKGKSDPVHTFRPLHPKLAPGRLRGIEGLDAPTIGREHEIATLRATLENLSRGVGSLLFLTGEAGMGKSRLLTEAGLILKQAPVPLQNFQIAPLSFEASQPYALFRSFLRQITGVDEMDSLETAHPKLTAYADRLPIEVRGGVTSAFASVLGVQAARITARDSDGEAFKRQLFATAREAVRVQFAGNPGMIVLDDLHWADPASLEIFGHLFPLVETVPILFLCATRPEREAPVWQVKTTLAEAYPHRFTEIPVQPLTNEDSNHLVDHLLTETELPARIRTMILAKSEGNPFFLEEIIRTLMDEGVLVQKLNPAGDVRHWHVAEEDLDTLHIPDNLQTLLAARLDRLAEETLRVVQMASVIGRTFNYRVLSTVTEAQTGLDGQLSTLQRMNMVVEAARLPELEYAFRHTLVQETAYRSILRKQRREFHRRVGETMEALFPARLDEYAPLLAMHFERAGEDARAFHYYLRAGDAAYRLHAVKEAITHYARAVDLLTNTAPIQAQVTNDTPRHLCLRLGRALEMDGQYEEALTHYIQMEASAQARGDRLLELAALTARATVHSAPTDKFDRTQAESLSKAALALAEDLGDHETEAKIYWNLMMMSGFSGQGEQGYQYGSRSLDIARRYNLREQLAFTLHDFHRAALTNGKLEEARNMLEEAQQLWLTLGNKAMYIDSLVSAALIYIIQGDYPRAEAVCQEALELSQEIGNLWGQSYSYYTLGFIHHELGRFTLALEVMDKALRLVEPSGFAVPLVDCNAYTGLIYGYLGDFERGKAFALVSLQQARERMPALQMGPLAILAILEAWQGNVQAVEDWLGDSEFTPGNNSFTGFERFIAEYYRLSMKREYEKLVALSEEALPFVRPMGDLVYIADILRLHGEALRHLNRTDEARIFLEEACLRAQHSPHRRIDALFALGRFEAAQGHEQAAQACLTEARQQIEIILQHVSDPDLHLSYLARPEIKAVLEFSL